jgi:H+/Cl- antiporter ClcA
MALEAMARGVDRLVIDSSDNLEAVRTRTARWQTTELYCWRTVVAIGLAVLVVFNIDHIVATIDSLTGIAKPTALLFQAIFGLGFAVIGYAAVTLVFALANLHRGLDMPKAERALEIFVPLVAGLAGAILHQG